KRIAALHIGDFLQVEGAAFSAHGNRFAVAGLGFGPRGNDIGRALIWEIPSSKQELSADDIKGPSQFMQDEMIWQITISDDGKRVGAATRETVLIWKRNNDTATQVARIPFKQAIYDVTFSADEQRVFTVSGGPAEGHLESWETAGYWQAVRIDYPGGTEN